MKTIQRIIVSLCVILALAIIILILILVRQNKSFIPKTGEGQGKPGTEQEIDVSVKELWASLDRFEDENGYVDPKNVTDALEAAYEQALEIPYVVTCSLDESSVLFTLSNDISYIYSPKIEGYLGGGGDHDLTITTIEPFHSDDNSVSMTGAFIANHDHDWFYSSKESLIKDEVTFDSLLHLADSKLIMWVGHAGYNASFGGYLCTGIHKSQVDTELFPSRTLCFTDADELVLYADLIDFLYPDKNAFKNALIYFGSCVLGKDSRFATAFLKKGAAFVVVYDEAIGIELESWIESFAFRSFVDLGHQQRYAKDCGADKVLSSGSKRCTLQEAFDIGRKLALKERSLKVKIFDLLMEEEFPNIVVYSTDATANMTYEEWKELIIPEEQSVYIPSDPVSSDENKTGEDSSGTEVENSSVIETPQMEESRVPEETEISTPEESDETEISQTSESSLVNHPQTLADWIDIYSNWMDTEYTGKMQSLPLLHAYALELTRDDRPELVLVESDYEQYHAYVFTPNENGTQLTLIYEDSGWTAHAGGYFGFYVHATDLENLTLVRERMNMWQGIGELSVTEFYLSNTGDIIEVESIVLSSDEPVSDEEYTAYCDSCRELLEECVSLGYGASESVGIYDSLHIDRIQIFRVVY